MIDVVAEEVELMEADVEVLTEVVEVMVGKGGGDGDGGGSDGGDGGDGGGGGVVKVMETVVGKDGDGVGVKVIEV